jgi:hypothetical protein
MVAYLLEYITLQTKINLWPGSLFGRRTPAKNAGAGAETEKELSALDQAFKGEL